MAYDINKSDGTLLVTIPDGDLDTSTSIKLLGKNFAGYGEIVAEDLVHMLEHFSSAAAPGNPIGGQLWFNPVTNRISVYDSQGNWKELGQLVAQINQPTGNTRRVGDFWYQTDIKQLWIWDGSKHQPVGFPSGATTIKFVRIKDVDSVLHDAIKVIMSGELMAIFSGEGPYTPHPDEKLEDTVGLLTAEFPQIGKGLQLTNRTGFKFRGIAVEAEFADLAEMYRSDKNYIAGTLIKIGGESEVTVVTTDADADIFGVVSTDPALLIGSRIGINETRVPVALKGRIPVRVIGEVKKGDKLVSSELAGVARSMKKGDDPYAVFGRALGNKDSSGEGKVEATIGVR
jgi:hypothetical protein